MTTKINLTEAFKAVLGGIDIKPLVIAEQFLELPAMSDRPVDIEFGWSAYFDPQKSYNANEEKTTFDKLIEKTGELSAGKVKLMRTACIGVTDQGGQKKMRYRIEGVVDNEVADFRVQTHSGTGRHAVSYIEDRNEEKGIGPRDGVESRKKEKHKATAKVDDVGKKNKIKQEVNDGKNGFDGFNG
jgi:hypothetical protein